MGPFVTLRGYRVLRVCFVVVILRRKPVVPTGVEPVTS